MCRYHGTGDVLLSYRSVPVQVFGALGSLLVSCDCFVLLCMYFTHRVVGVRYVHVLCRACVSVHLVFVCRATMSAWDS